MISTILLLILAAYLLGSIPTSVWVSKWFYHIDIREHGSGNAGATNTIRVLGANVGIPVFLFDVFKAWTAVFLSHFASVDPGSNAFIHLKLALGITAVIGHIFPVFAGFRGGKGVACLLGMVIGITPLAAFICFGIFIIVFIFTKIVSVGSVIAGMCYPVLVIVIFQYQSIALILFSLLAAILLLITHRNNIRRLIKGEEPKSSLFSKKTKPRA